MFCSNCGSKVPEGSKFCPNCGEIVNMPAAQQQGHDPRTSISLSKDSEPYRDYGTPKDYGPPYANFGLRLAAYIIDSLIVFVPTFVVAFVFGFMFALSGGDESGSTFLGELIGLCAGWLYSALMESSPLQATLGKKMLGLKVTDMNGERISFGRATGRYFSKFLSSIFLIGYIMAAFTEKKQALHDMIATTLVVEQK